LRWQELPVEVGLVASLARSGGNVTGVTTLSVELVAKRLELLHDMVPAVKVLALLVNPTSRVVSESMIKNVQAAAHTLGLKLQVLYASAEHDFDTAFTSVRELRAGDRHRPILHRPGRAVRAAGGSLRGAHDLPVSRVRRGRRLGKLRRQRQPTPWASISFTPRMTDYPRESNDTPSEYAFCCVARSVRLSDFAIFTRGVF
jgi:ABC transporter substrate binding protein